MELATDAVRAISLSKILEMKTWSAPATLKRSKSFSRSRSICLVIVARTKKPLRTESAAKIPKIIEVLSTISKIRANILSTSRTEIFENFTSKV